MSDWYTCTVCGTYFGGETLEKHLTSVKHIARVISDTSSVPRYVFNCNPPSHVEYKSTGYESLPSRENLWKDYYSYSLEEQELKNKPIIPANGETTGSEDKETTGTDDSDESSSSDESSEESSSSDEETTTQITEKIIQVGDTSSSESSDESSLSDETTEDSSSDDEKEKVSPEDKNPVNDIHEMNEEYELEKALLDIAMQESLEEIKHIEELQKDIAIVASIDDEQEHIRKDFEEAIHSGSVNKYAELEKELANKLAYELMYELSSDEEADISSDSYSEHDYNSFTDSEDELD